MHPLQPGSQHTRFARVTATACAETLAGEDAVMLCTCNGSQERSNYMLFGGADPEGPSWLEVTYAYQESDHKMTLNVQWEVSIYEVTLLTATVSHLLYFFEIVYTT